MTTTRGTIIGRGVAHDMLTAAQKRSRTRTFSSVEEIAGTVASVVEDCWVFAALTLDQLDGITLTVDAAQGEHFPSGYAGRPQSTHATLRFTPRGWIVESVSRGDVSTRSTTPWRNLTLSREQLDLAASRWGTGFGITLTND